MVLITVVCAILSFVYPILSDRISADTKSELSKRESEIAALRAELSTVKSSETTWKAEAQALKEQLSKIRDELTAKRAEDLQRELQNIFFKNTPYPAELNSVRIGMTEQAALRSVGSVGRKTGENIYMPCVDRHLFTCAIYTTMKDGRESRIDTAQYTIFPGDESFEMHNAVVAILKRRYAKHVMRESTGHNSWYTLTIYAVDGLDIRIQEGTMTLSRSVSRR